MAAHALPLQDREWIGFRRDEDGCDRRWGNRKDREENGAGE